jgi:hypothetical protein
MTASPNGINYRYHCRVLWHPPVTVRVCTCHGYTQSRKTRTGKTVAIACRYDAERLKGVYGLRSDGCTPSKVVYCHLHCWYGTEGPHSKCQVTNEAPECEISQQLLTSFDSLWKHWVRNEIHASTRSAAENVPASDQFDRDAAINSGEDETPKGHKIGTVFSCKITQNGVQPNHHQGVGRELAAARACSRSGVVPVDTPPRKRAREEPQFNAAVKRNAAVGSMYVGKSSLEGIDVALDTDEEAEDEENQGGVLTQPGIQLM